MRVVFITCALIVTVFGRKGFGPTDQEWGFVTVREHAHMFWWLHYTTANVTNVTDRPLVIWLQGGPGASSTGYGNFAELGPLDVNLKPRNTSWDKNVNVLFVDNPVGTGYSYVDNDNALTTTNRQIALDFVELLKGFFKEVGKFKTVPLYIFCESYGGKMTAEIALVLNKEIKAGNIECRLEGVGLGDSWISPIDSVLTWAPYLLNVGMIDHTSFESIMVVANKTQEALNSGQFAKATGYWGETEDMIDLYTQGVDFYNILKKIEGRNKASSMKLRDSDDDDDYKIQKLMNGPVREALNISREWGIQADEVFTTLNEDFMKPVTQVVGEILNTTDITVAVYNGQLDLIVDTPGTVKWLENLHWTNSSSWKGVSLTAFSIYGYQEGYEKKLKNLQYYSVLRSGHMVPADNPAAMHYILKDVTNNFAV